MQLILILIIVLMAAPVTAGDWIAVVDVTQDGRIAKFQEYETEADAAAHVDRVLPQYPDAFVVQRPAGDGKQPLFWKLDKSAKTAVVDVPVEYVREKVERHADQLIAEAVPPEQVDKMLARATRLNAEVSIKGRTLTVAEQAEVDDLIAIDDWRMAVRARATDFIIDTLPGLTEQEKMDFDPAAGITWPAEPMK
jgi:hypothetical protein